MLMTEASDDLVEALARIANMQNAELPDDHRYAADRRDGRLYSYTDEIVLGLQVSVITSRPLLLSGPPGCGKSSLAGFVARNLGYSYHEYVVTEDSDPVDLLWRLDVIRRLNDASGGSLRKNEAGQAPLLDYLEPGPLWWALNPDSAATRNLEADDFAKLGQAPLTPPQHLAGYKPSRRGAVLLIDEIDKADSAFCNGLLVPLGSRQFPVAEVDTKVYVSPDQPTFSPIVIVTTNDERDLPEAFIRRCVSMPIPRPGKDQLLAAARLHYPTLSSENGFRDRVDALAERFAAGSGGAVHASTAEFLDLIGTLLALDMSIDSPDWSIIERLVVEKPAARREW
ncbi:AAA family ATPase [Mycobacterium sp. PSTR-4-N]|uniref:AAA family ATPase n=1 Tax=Mycobacterium sp. PSTR-4-N TaxID=2917745 RepID=UPI001F153E76|nr:MoxR family ATPase [Mycobacterium sp. PSTR-4-N]MCG7597149.1 MoxR family ATPase [Mycobacterium sp. PSTR-4-N]